MSEEPYKADPMILSDLTLKQKLEDAIMDACDEHECMPDELDDDCITDITIAEIRTMLRILEERT